MGQKKKISRRAGSFPAEFRIRVVKLFLEEGYTISMLAEEFGCSKSIISSWLKVYREQGESGLNRPSTSQNKARKVLNPNLKSKIIELKKEDPQRGVRRISDIMRRFFMLQASPETVRKTLHEEKLIDPPPKKRRKNIQKPRRFERADCFVPLGLMSHPSPSQAGQGTSMSPPLQASQSMRVKP